MIFTKEISMFIKAMTHDRNHLRNIMYVMISASSSIPGAQIAYSILLLDLLNKVQTLGRIILVFTDNAVGLGSVGILFLVLLYLYAFFAFNYVRVDYKQNFNTGSNFYQNHAPVSPGGTYNMDCSTLTNCFISTASFGMRSGGGIGDALW
jgi:ABC-type tungstate transport system substrate-binding protein